MPSSPNGPDRSGPEILYHVIGRTALDGLPFKNFEKDERVRGIRWFPMVYAVDVLDFSIMDNHFHLLIEMSQGELLAGDEVRRRWMLLYNKGGFVYRNGIERGDLSPPT